MSAAALLAQATEADRAADAIFARAEAARGNSLALRVAGFERELERASDLRRRARFLRADAASFAPPPPVVVAPAATVRSVASPSTAARVAPPSSREAAVETADDVARRILASDGPDSIPADKDVPRDNKRIQKGDGPADVEDVARRILNA